MNHHHSQHEPIAGPSRLGGPSGRSSQSDVPDRRSLVSRPLYQLSTGGGAQSAVLPSATRNFQIAAQSSPAQPWRRLTRGFDPINIRRSQHSGHDRYRTLDSNSINTRYGLRHTAVPLRQNGMLGPTTTSKSAYPPTGPWQELNFTDDANTSDADHGSRSRTSAHHRVMTASKTITLQRPPLVARALPRQTPSGGNFYVKNGIVRPVSSSSDSEINSSSSFVPLIYQKPCRDADQEIKATKVPHLFSLIVKKNIREVWPRRGEVDL